METNYYEAYDRDNVTLVDVRSTPISRVTETGIQVGDTGHELDVMIKIIEADGSYLERHTGSHRQFRHPTNPGTTTIAGKPSTTLPLGTEKSILRQAGIDWRRR